MGRGLLAGTGVNMWRRYLVKGVLVTLLSIGTVAGFASGAKHLEHRLHDGSVWGWKSHYCGHHQGRSTAGEGHHAHGCCSTGDAEVNRHREDEAPSATPQSQE